MTTIDITRYVLNHDNNHFPEIKRWLGENVGEYYGPGTGRDRVVAVGAGWEIVVTEETEDDGAVAIGWAVEIEDSSAATMFSLRWA